MNSFFGLIKTLISQFGYFGIFLVMFADTLNIPAASEITLIFTGFLINTGYFNFYAALLAVVLGNFLGAVVNFRLGRLGKKIFIKQEHIDKGEKFLNRFGKASALVGYLLPFIRSFIAFVLGFFGFEFKSFSKLALLGQLIWALVFISLGIVFGANWQNILPFLQRLDIILIGSAILVFAALVYFYQRKKKNASN